MKTSRKRSDWTCRRDIVAKRGLHPKQCAGPGLAGLGVDEEEARAVAQRGNVLSETRALLPEESAREMRPSL